MRFIFSRTAVDVSRAKINQHGYFQVPNEPVVEPIEGEKQVKVTFDGLEQGRNEIQIGGGYSGLDGAFFNGVYSTRNFLGRGQTVATAIQIGGRSTASPRQARRNSASPPSGPLIPRAAAWRSCSAA